MTRFAHWTALIDIVAQQASELLAAQLSAHGPPALTVRASEEWGGVVCMG